MTNAAGAVVPGTLSPTHLSWRSGAWLQPATTYRVVATVARPDGVTAQRASTFTTVTPTALVTASVYPYDGMNVGVGQPIVFTFNHYVDTAAAQAAVLSHLSVSMSKPVPGGWHWFSADELHFRPEAYWPAGEKITVTGDLDGWDAANGRWGSGQINDTFTIGDARISVANLQTEEMTVTLNGATVGVYPISGGRTQYPTMDGDPHRARPRERGAHGVVDGRHPRQLAQRLRRAGVRRRAHLRQRRVRARRPVVGRRARAGRTCPTAASTSRPPTP